jgi:hypothetical protein
MCSNACNNFKISDDCCDDNGNSLETVSIENPITLSIPANPSVWADASGPIPKETLLPIVDLSGLAVQFYDGWYFKNILGRVGPTLGSKINWNIYPPNSSISPATITNADIQSLAIANFVIKNDSPLYITYYTQIDPLDPTNLPDGPATPAPPVPRFYKSRLNYRVKNPEALSEYTNYLFKIKFDQNAQDYYMPYGATQLDLELDASSSYYTKGGVDINFPEDKIRYWAISSNSGAESCEVESIVSKFIVQIKDDRVYSCEFNNASVLAYNNFINSLPAQQQTNILTSTTDVGKMFEPEL